MLYFGVENSFSPPKIKPTPHFKINPNADLGNEASRCPRMERKTTTTKQGNNCPHLTIPHCSQKAINSSRLFIPQNRRRWTSAESPGVKSNSFCATIVKCSRLHLSMHTTFLPKLATAAANERARIHWQPHNTEHQSRNPSEPLKSLPSLSRSSQ